MNNPLPGAESPTPRTNRLRDSVIDALGRYHRGEIYLEDLQCFVRMAFSDASYVERELTEARAQVEEVHREVEVANTQRALDIKENANLSAQLLALQADKGELNRRLEEQHKLYCAETNRHNETWAKIHAAMAHLNKEFKKLPEDLVEAVKEVISRRK